MEFSPTEDRFPSPPQTFSDKTGRQITIKAYDGGPDLLVEMYADFDEPATRGLPPQDEETIRNWVGTHLEEGLNVVARHNWRVVGHAALIPHGDTAELIIFVHPNEQSKGIGTELLETLLGYGKEQGVENVWLSVAADNLALIRITTSVGFKPPKNSQVEFKLGCEL